MSEKELKSGRFCPLPEHNGAKIPAKAYLVRVYGDPRAPQEELSTGLKVVLCDDHWAALRAVIETWSGR